MTTAVIGATGKVGRRVAHRLHLDGIDVRSASRHPERAPAGTHGVRFDWTDPATWDEVVDGVEAMFVIGPFSHPDPGRTLSEFLAVAGDVRRVVLLSSMGVAEPGDGSSIGAMEQAVVESGLAWTVLRSSWFMQNFTENPGLALGIEQRCELIASLDASAVSFVDTRDIADVAAAVLADDRHAGQTYRVTGPRALTLSEVAALLGAATGRTLHYRAPSPDEAAQLLSDVGLPAPMIGVLRHVDAATRQGTFSPVSDDVPRLLGRPARDFADYLDEVASTAAWAPA